MRRFGFAVGCVVAVLVAFEAGTALATITLNSASDTWVRESNPGRAYYGDNAISVWAGSPSTGDQRRSGALEFDLSSVSDPITSARIELYAMPVTGADSCSYDANEFKVTASTIVSSDPGTYNFSTMTWNNVSTGWAKTALESFGHFNLPAGASDATNGGWVSTLSASASDLAVLNAIRTGSNKAVDLLMEATDQTMVGNGHNFFNAVYGVAYTPRLVLNEPVPEPSTIALLAAAMLSLLAYAWRRRR